VIKLFDVPGAGNCLPRNDRVGDQFPVYEESQPMYPRADWPDLVRDCPGLEAMVAKIKDQGNEGTCASNAAAQCFEIIWNRTYGLANALEISPISVYRWIAPGPSSGSTISDNLQQLRAVGCLPVNSDSSRAVLSQAGRPVTHVLEPTGYGQRFPAGWEETAAFLQAAEWFDVASFEGLFSALIEGWPICYGRAGHAICGVRPVRDQSAWVVKYANSWKKSWGENGYGYDTERYIAQAIRQYGAWALRAVKITDAFLSLIEDDPV